MIQCASALLFVSVIDVIIILIISHSSVGNDGQSEFLHLKKSVSL